MVTIYDIDGNVLHTIPDKDTFEELWLEGVCLDRADFRGKNLCGSYFSECSLKGARFDNAEVHDITFVFCDLTGCNFSEMFLWGSEFTHCNLTDCDFSFADCENCEFYGSTITGTNFDDANFNGSSFEVNARHGTEIEVGRDCYD